MPRIGVDFGGTKIEIAALSEAGDWLTRRRAATPQDYAGAVQAVLGLIAEVERDLGPAAAVGVAAPGSISPFTGVMRNANSQFLNGRDFRGDLEAALGKPVMLDNDANCLALSEATDGAGQGAESVFAVILGTGCGGGLAVGGRLLEGASRVAGEWGHNPLPWPSADEYPGPDCWCGRTGCLETWVSGSGFRADHERRTGRRLSGEAIVSAARAGDAAARESLERLTSRLGRGLAAVVNLFDPDVIVLGGGLSSVAELYPALQQEIPRWVFGGEWRGRIAPPRWGDSSGVRGAAWLPAR